jgi:hypothetical protein
VLIDPGPVVAGQSPSALTTGFPGCCPQPLAQEIKARLEDIVLEGLGVGEQDFYR